MIGELMPPLPLHHCADFESEARRGPFDHLMLAAVPVAFIAVFFLIGESIVKVEPVDVGVQTGAQYGTD